MRRDRNQQSAGAGRGEPRPGNNETKATSNGSSSGNNNNSSSSGLNSSMEEDLLRLRPERFGKHNQKQRRKERSRSQGEQFDDLPEILSFLDKPDGHDDDNNSSSNKSNNNISQRTKHRRKPSHHPGNDNKKDRERQAQTMLQLGPIGRLKMLNCFSTGKQQQQQQQRHHNQQSRAAALDEACRRYGLDAGDTQEFHCYDEDDYGEGNSLAASASVATTTEHDEPRFLLRSDSDRGGENDPRGGNGTSAHGRTRSHRKKSNSNNNNNSTRSRRSGSTRQILTELAEEEDELNSIHQQNDRRLSNQTPTSTPSSQQQQQKPSPPSTPPIFQPQQQRISATTSVARGATTPPGGASSKSWMVRRKPQQQRYLGNDDEQSSIDYYYHSANTSTETDTTNSTMTQVVNLAHERKRDNNNNNNDFTKPLPVKVPLRPRCHFCGGDHWIYDCPVLQEEKRNADRRVKAITNGKTQHATTTTKTRNAQTAVDESYETGNEGDDEDSAAVLSSSRGKAPIGNDEETSVVSSQGYTLRCQVCFRLK